MELVCGAWCTVLHSKGGNIAQAEKEAMDSCWFVGAWGEKMCTWGMDNLRVGV